MKPKKTLRFGKYTFVAGIASGFVFLFGFFAVLKGNLQTYETIGMAALCAVSMYFFLVSMEEGEKASSKK